MKSSFLNLIARLWGHLTLSRRRQFIGLLFISSIASIAEIFSIGLAIPFLKVLVSPSETVQFITDFSAFQYPKIFNTENILWVVTIGFIATALISGALRLFLLWAQSRVSHGIGADISCGIYRRTLYQPYITHLSRNSSLLISAISNKTNVVVFQIILPILTIFCSSTLIILALVLLIAINPMTAISVFAIITAIYLMVMFLTRKVIFQNSNQINKESSRVIRLLQEGLGGIRDILISGTQEVYYSAFCKADIRLRRSQANMQIVGSAPRYVIEPLGMIGIAIFAYAMVAEGNEIATAIPILGVMVLAAQRLLPALQQGYAAWALMKGGEASLADVLELLDQKIPEVFISTKNQKIVFNREICLQQLRFRYPNHSKWVLRSIDLAIKKGEYIGFIGSTGSGKTTLLDIVMGLLRPSFGSLIVDDVTITDENYSEWQSHISHVPQNIFLSDSTIAENIAMGVAVQEIDYCLLHEVAKKAQIADVIESLKDGYQTIVGERGARLSGGQRQRLGIARALYRGSDILIFDEATSSLDGETEKAVMSAIESLSSNLTIIVVAHRLSTLRNCSKIIELKDGSIARIGTFKNIVEPML